MPVKKTKKRITITVEKTMLDFVDETIAHMNKQDRITQWDRSKFFTRLLLIVYNDNVPKEENKANA